MHIIMAKAVAFGEALEDSFKVYAKQVIANANALANKLITFGFDVISAGTDNHLMLIDLTNLPAGKTGKNITGKQAENSLELAGMTVNKNMVPFDQRSPFVTSGIRIGTPALTTRGMKENEMVKIAEFINEAVNKYDDESALTEIKNTIKNFTKNFPLYSDLINK